MAIAMQNDHALLCFDIFCDSASSMTSIVNELAAQHTRQVILGFTPREDRAGEYEKIEIDDFLFIYTAKEISLRSVS